MTSLPNRLPLCLCLLQIIVTQAEFEDHPSTLISFAEQDTVLLCKYQPSTDKVVQVTWYKRSSDADKEQIITAHYSNGQTAFGTWSQRVRFKSSEPTVDSSLVIMGTEVSDEGDYICHISTFPSGNFEREISVTVWITPISSLDPVIVVEGQPHQQVASCRSVAHPRPRLSWDTMLNGQAANRSVDSRTVSTQFSLHPLRSMNGKKLDCLVWHPAFPAPRRLTNNLVVHYPPDAEVSGYNDKWFVGLRNAALTCVSGGNPKPHSFTWTRVGGQLPKGATPYPNGTLVFGGPLNSSVEGIYQCVAENKVGKDMAEVEIRLTADAPVEEPEIKMLVIGVAAGALTLMLLIVIIITCRHKRKKKQLMAELSQKTKEINTLSREASIRRGNSVSTFARDLTEEHIPLKVEGTLRNSLSSLGEQARCRDSRSTVSGGRAGGMTYDSLGRPALCNNSRRGRGMLLEREDSRLRVEAYVRNAMSLQDNFHPPLAPSTFPVVQSADALRPMNGSVILPAGGGSRHGSIIRNHQHPPVSYVFPHVTDDEDEVDEGLGGPASQEHPDDQDSETHSFHLHEAHSTKIPQSRTSHPLIDPHASMIHKAQIV